MSTPSKRKFDKQQERKKRLAQKKQVTERQSALSHKRQVYSETFPEFVFVPGNAPTGFVDVIREAVAKLNFENRNQFGRSECGFFATLKLDPIEAERFLHSLRETDFKGHVHLMTIIGSLVFAQDHERIKQWLPFNDVRFWLDFRHGQILVKFDSLLEQKSPNGTIYYSKHRPSLEFDGEMKVVGWRRHAIERVCQRLVYDWQTYAGVGDAFAYLNRCMHFEKTILYPDRIGFTFFENCVPGGSGELAEAVLGDASKKGDWFYRLAHCGADIEGDFIVARTALFPGHEGTPEYSLLLKSRLPYETKERMKRELWGMDFQKQVTHESLGFIKWFHDNGVPQVVRGEPSWFFE